MFTLNSKMLHNGPYWSKWIPYVGYNYSLDTTPLHRIQLLKNEKKTLTIPLSQYEDWGQYQLLGAAGSLKTGRSCAQGFQIFICICFLNVLDFFCFFSSQEEQSPCGRLTEDRGRGSLLRRGSRPPPMSLAHLLNWSPNTNTSAPPSTNTSATLSTNASAPSTNTSVPARWER